LTQDNFIKSKHVATQQGFVSVTVTLNEIYDISQTIHGVVFPTPLAIPQKISKSCYVKLLMSLVAVETTMSVQDPRGSHPCIFVARRRGGPALPSDSGYPFLSPRTTHMEYFGAIIVPGQDT
jgi:hypothetical protein